MKVEFDSNPVDRYAEITLEKDNEFIRINTDSGCLIVSKDGSFSSIPREKDITVDREFQTAIKQADTDSVSEEARNVLRQFGLDF